MGSAAAARASMGVQRPFRAPKGPYLREKNLALAAHRQPDSPPPEPTVTRTTQHTLAIRGSSRHHLTIMAVEHPIRMIDSVPPEVVVHDEPGPCSYLSGRQWRLPLRLPMRALSRRELDQRLAVGDRRQGRLLYRPSCDACQACEAIRIEVDRFRPSRTQRRVWRRGLGLISLEIGPPTVDDQRLELYHRHKRERNLSLGEDPLSAELYRLVLSDSCCETIELRYRVDEQLMGIALVDRAARSMSAVYTYFNPDYARLSPGVFSILAQIELGRRWGLRFVYLGLYIAECRAMAYKSSYLPHQRLVDGRWQSFERPSEPTG